MNHAPLMRGGYLLIHILIVSAIATLLIGGFVRWSGNSLAVARSQFYREQALQIAEAGIEYYRWHLAHDPDDFTDGTGAEGPYVHEFLDKDGNRIGEFSLAIDAPISGSTLVTIESTGTVDAAPGVERAIRVQLAIPSFAKYAWVLNDFARFGSTAEVFGILHSNSGLEFNGLAHNIVTSAVETYGSNWGVYTEDAPADPSPPTPPYDRPDIFEAGRAFPVPAVDFVGLTADLSDLKSLAQNGGFYRGDSGAQGWHVVLRTDGRFNLYRVNSKSSVSWSCDNPSWSVSSQSLISGSPFLIPENGVLFFEDDVWVDGSINGSRVIVGSGKFPDVSSSRTTIIINNDIRYTNYDGSDVVGLIAQKDVLIGLNSENDLRIDGALVAQNGAFKRLYYGSFCGANRVRDLLTTYGMIASNDQSGVAYGNPVTSGYEERVYNYDANLLYSPPPHFPLTTDEYVILSWEEI